MKPITEYVQQDPHEGAPASERTESWVLYDDRNIYVACRCLDEHPERMVANEMRRDSTNLRQNDNFAVELDTFHDKRNGFLFYITPVGGMWDSLTTDERSNNGDWNTVWEAKARRTANGWIAERHPFKSLRHKPADQSGASTCDAASVTRTSTAYFADRRSGVGAYLSRVGGRTLARRLPRA